ncbi:MAG: lysoplasmalogenase family protein, partial [Oscillospiraceae bacterium]|nr:lysoplasmalogenase family protein [Oscillospiraceae bacterium]
AFMLLVSRPCAATALTYIGAVSCFASDSLLFLRKFYKKPIWRGYFSVMITYIIAEFLITQGILMLG